MLDPFDSSLTDVPYDEIAEMRQQCPVAHLDSGFFFASRHDDVAAALKDGGPRVKVFSHEGKMRALDVVVPDDEQLTGEIEGPRHTRLRQLLMTALHQRLVAGSETFVRELSRSLLEGMIERGHADLVAEYAVPIPSQVLAHIIGLPREDFVRFPRGAKKSSAATTQPRTSPIAATACRARIRSSARISTLSRPIGWRTPVTTSSAAWCTQRSTAVASTSRRSAVRSPTSSWRATRPRRI